MPQRLAALPISSGHDVLRSLKTSESTARDIVRDIVAKGLNHGDVLPSEALMLTEYGVSRESLREALRLLEAQGLITIRRGPGGGPIVGTIDPANLGRTSTLYYHLAGSTYRELFDAWAIAEGYLAERAARNPDRALVRERMSPYLHDDDYFDDVEAYVQHHIEFHLTVGTLADNRVMQLSLMSIGAIVTHHFVLENDPRFLRDQIHDDHMCVAKAIIAGKPVKARREASAHLMRVSAEYERLAGPNALDQLIEWL